MKQTLSRTVTMLGGLLVALVAAGRTQAPAGHAHTSPHGGDIVEVANHHVEFKADSAGSIAVWLLDSHEKTVAPPTGASVTLIDATGGQATVPLQVDREAQRLVARFDPRKFATFQAIVSLAIAGTRHNVRFRYPAHH